MIRFYLNEEPILENVPIPAIKAHLFYTPIFFMMSFDLYAIGNALVDSEYVVTDRFLTEQNIHKGQMTLIDGQQQQTLLNALNAEFSCAKRASGGSAANSVIAFAALGGSAFYACKVANDHNGDFYLHDLRAAKVSAQPCPSG